jgi:hypothetical protein
MGETLSRNNLNGVWLTELPSAEGAAKGGDYGI